MPSSSVFSITVPGKWILVGEHTVIRGGEALVFPLHSKYLKLDYFLNSSENSQEFKIKLLGQNTSELELIIWSVLERALNILNLKRQQLQGTLQLDSCIALGGGMGASATLCVALTEWLSYLGYIADDNKFNFARELENLFHGESSGVDVAVTLANKPLVFTRHAGFSELNAEFKPLLYLSYSGERGVTKDCVEKVKNLFIKSPDLAVAIDEQMKESVAQMKELLSQKSSLIDWIKALKKAHNCFEQWGLVSENVKQHQKVLLDHGALAVKLTGSGGGGYVLSLWESPPAQDINCEMIACF